MFLVRNKIEQQQKQSLSFLLRHNTDGVDQREDGFAYLDDVNWKAPETEVGGTTLPKTLSWKNVRFFPQLSHFSKI